ncbi:TPA: hypothetical protein ACG5O7_004874, partial [Escherichia coli]
QRHRVGFDLAFRASKTGEHGDSILKKLLIDRPPESAKWQEASKFNFEEIANLRRRFHFLSAHPK